MAATTTTEVILNVSLSEIIHYASSKLPAKFAAFVNPVTIISLPHSRAHRSISVKDGCRKPPVYFIAFQVIFCIL